MLDYAREAVALMDDMTVHELLAHRERQLALVRLVEIVGEAASQVDDETRARHAEVPWRKAIGMRNMLIHRYPTVDVATVHDTVRDSLPPLIAQLEAILG